MNNWLERLRTREHDIKIGIVGIGSIGKGMAVQAELTPGIHCIAIADIIIERAIAAAQLLQREFQVVHSLDEMQNAVHRGRLAVCSDGNLVARCQALEVFIEATNAVAGGGQHALTAIEHNKQIVMMNYEADLMFGPYLMAMAEENGCVYTVCDGDQPAVLKHIIDEMEFMGFQLVMAGNIKGFLDRYADPTSIIPEADKRNLDYRMCTSYTDGTKLAVEMAVLANGLGLRTAIPGMYGPRIDDIHQVFDCFDFASLWDGRQGVVDYVLGASPVGGVFAIGYSDHDFQKMTLDWFPPDMGPGPFYLFYRPYHLGHLESMATVASVALDEQAVLKPDCGFQTNVYAYAKQDLCEGGILDGIGGYACYGIIENCADNINSPGIPICLAEDVVLKHNIARDQKILLDDVVLDPNDYAYCLHLKAVEQAAISHSGQPQLEN